LDKSVNIVIAQGHTHARSVLLLEETGVPGENHRPAEYHWQTLSIIGYTLPWASFELTRHWLHKLL